MWAVWGICFLSSFNYQSTAYLLFLTKLLCSCMLWLLLCSTRLCLQIFCLRTHAHRVCFVHDIQMLFCLPQVFVSYSFLILKKYLALLFHKHQEVLFAWGTCYYLDTVPNWDGFKISSHKVQTCCHVHPCSKTFHWSMGAATCFLAWLCSPPLSLKSFL